MGLVEFHRYEHTASSTKWPPFVRYFHMSFPDENMSFDSNSPKFALEGPIENKSIVSQVIVWCLPGNKTVYDWMWVKCLTPHVSRRMCMPPTRNVKLRDAHAPGMPGMFSPSPTSKETVTLWSRYASRLVRPARPVMHVGIANPQWRRKRYRHPRRMRNT